LLAALQAGAVGTFDTLARHAGVPEMQARQTLGNMRREGVIATQRPAATGSTFPQRLRAIYTPASNDTAFDVLSFARQVWR
jgi:DNA-binding IscR family transcriptional regulator